jgi:CRISPR/Cas system CMR subunit Cmr6 (Cas7 group RAMP superfamily)
MNGSMKEFSQDIESRLKDAQSKCVKKYGLGKPKTNVGYSSFKHQDYDAL